MVDEEIIVDESMCCRGDFILKPFKGVKYFIANKDESNMIIPFGNYFQEFGKSFETFKMSLSSKRTFKRLSEDIADDNNRVLNHHFSESVIQDDSTTIKKDYNKNRDVANQFILGYLSLKMNLDEGGELTKVPYQMFIIELLNIIPDDLMKMIIHYTNSIYMGSMDEVIDVDKHNFEMSTTFVDADIKQLCHVKYAGNLLIPICTHYCNVMIREVDPKEFFLDLYKSLFQRVAIGTTLNTLEKLHKYVTMIVGNAFKRHKPIYNRMSIGGTTQDNEIEEVFSKILTTIITKFQPKDTVPAFIAEVVKNSSSKFKPREDDGYNVLQGFSDDYVHSGSDDSMVTEAERMESRIARPDELLKIVRKNSCDDTINKISYRYGVFIDSVEEYKFNLDNLILHEYQTKIIFQTFSHHYGGYENMFDNNRHNYVRLLILATKHLRKEGLDIIADYVNSHCAGYSFTSRWSKVSDRKLFEDKRYDEIIDTKYKHTKAQFEHKNFIRDDIVLLSNNIFKYNAFNDERNGSIIKHTDEEIIDGVLNYYLKIIY